MTEQPQTKTIPISEVRQHISQVLTQVYHGETRVIIEKSGIPVAALISPQELAAFLRFEATRTQRFKILDSVRATFATIPDDELEQEVTSAVTEARTALQAERAAHAS